MSRRASVVHVYADEDVDILLVKLLGHRGLNVTTALDKRMLHKGDPEQLEMAISLDAVMLTHNRDDFEELFTMYVEQGRPFSGIVIAKQRNVFDLADRLARLFHNNKDFKNQLWYV